MWLTLLLFFVLGVHSNIRCDHHCKYHDCTVFNGNLTDECGLCDYTSKCYPGAVGFNDWHVRSYNYHMTSSS